MMSEDTWKQIDAPLAYLFLRATLGINILIHGIARILGGTGQFASGIISEFHSTPLPHGLVAAFAYSLPWIEAILGTLVLVGLFTRLALSGGALLILVLTFGTTLQQDWNTAGLQLIYAAIYAALLAYLSANRYSLDALFHREK